MRISGAAAVAWAACAVWTAAGQPAIPANANCRLYNNQFTLFFGPVTLRCPEHRQNGQPGNLTQSNYAWPSNMSALSVGFNQITSIVARAFSRSPGLIRLDMENNPITTISVSAFLGVPNLGDVRIDKCRITVFPVGVFAGLNRLTALSIDGNHLTSRLLPLGLFSGLNRLDDLDVSNMSLTAVTPGTFNGLSALDELKMENNWLTQLRCGMLDGLTNLTELDLDANNISQIERGVFRAVPRLDELDLEENLLSSLPDNTFDGAAALTQLDLNHNLLTTIGRLTFAGLTNLEDLDLDSNMIRSVETGAMASLTRVDYLSLGNNVAQFTAVAGSSTTFFPVHLPPPPGQPWVGPYNYQAYFNGSAVQVVSCNSTAGVGGPSAFAHLRTDGSYRCCASAPTSQAPQGVCPRPAAGGQVCAGQSASIPPTPPPTTVQHTSAAPRSVAPTRAPSVAPTAAPTAPQWVISITFSGDCSTLDATAIASIVAAIQQRLSMENITASSTITVRCGSIVATVTLPQTVPSPSITAFSSSVNTSAITVPGTTFASVTGAVVVSQTNSGATQGNASEEDSGVALWVIAVAVVLTVALLGAIVVAVIVARGRGSEAPPAAASVGTKTLVNPVSKQNPSFEA